MLNEDDNILPPPSMQEAGLFPESDILFPSYLGKENEKGQNKSFKSCGGYQIAMSNRCIPF